MFEAWNGNLSEFTSRGKVRKVKTLEQNDVLCATSQLEIIRHHGRKTTAIARLLRTGSIIEQQLVSNDVDPIVNVYMIKARKAPSPQDPEIPPRSQP